MGLTTNTAQRRPAAAQGHGPEKGFTPLTRTADADGPARGAAVATGGHDFARLALQPPPGPAVQRKMEVSQPGDPAEQEADRVADDVMRMPGEEAQAGAVSVAQAPGTEGGLPASRSGDIAPGTDVSGEVESGLAGGGSPLDADARDFLEPRFGHDFSNVRVHTDADAGRSAQAVAARAYAVGSDIAFAPGQYQPGTADGRRLLAHELTHVVQQGGATAGAARQTVSRFRIPEAPPPEDEQAPPVTPDNPNNVPIGPPQADGTPPAAPESDRTVNNWGDKVTAVAGAMDATWAGSPAFQPDAVMSNSDGGAPARDAASQQAGKTKFTQDWAQAQTNWNAVSVLVAGYREAAKNAEAEGVTGPATATNPAGVIRKPKDRGLDLAGAVEQGKAVGTKSDVKIGDLFEGGNLKSSVENTKLDRGDALDAKVDEVTATSQRELDDATDEIAKATNDYKGKVLEVKNALLELQIKQSDKQTAGAETEKVQIEREKAIVVGGIEAVANIFKMGESYLGARSGEKPDTTGKAAAGSGIVDAAAGAVGYFVGQSYDEDIHSVNLKLQSAKQFAAARGEEIAKNKVDAAIGACQTQEIVIRQAKRKLIAAEQKRRDAIKALATAARESAAKAGASKAEQDRIDTAIRALPAVELVLSRLRNITSKVQLPVYTEPSGVGAALATNANEFISHGSILLGTAAEFKQAEPVWEARLAEVQALIRNLNSSSVE